MNTTVTSTGIDLTVITSESLLINTDLSAGATDGSWSTKIALDNTSYVGKKLYPVSSYNGVTMTYVKDNNTTGTYNETLDTEAKAYTTTSSAVSGDTAGLYYVDYQLAIMYAGQDATKNIYLDTTNFSVVGKTDSDKIYQAVRVALLNEDGSAVAQTGKTNRYDASETNSYITAGADAAVKQNAVTTDAHLINNTAVLTLTKDVPVSITVRIWIEGENKNCIDSYAGGDFSVQLGFTTTTP